jgi:hypothetical protein
MMGYSRGEKSEVTVKAGAFTLQPVALQRSTYVNGEVGVDASGLYGATVNTLNVGDKSSVVDIPLGSLNISLTNVSCICFHSYIDLIFL